MIGADEIMSSRTADRPEATPERSPKRAVAEISVERITELAGPVIDHDGVAQHGQPVRAGKTRGPTTNNGNLLAARFAAFEQLRARLEDRVGRIALQQADLDGLVFVCVTYAGFLAKYLGRTNPGTHAAHDVLLQDGMRRTANIVAANFLDECGNIDAGRTRCRAGRVIAEVAAIRLDQRLRARQRRMHVTEITR